MVSCRCRHTNEPPEPTLGARRRRAGTKSRTRPGRAGGGVWCTAPASGRAGGPDLQGAPVVGPRASSRPRSGRGSPGLDWPGAYRSFCPSGGMSFGVVEGEPDAGAAGADRRRDRGPPVRADHVHRAALGAGRRPAALADPAQQGGLRRAQLRRARRRARQRGAQGAAAVPQAVHVGDRAARRDPAAAAVASRSSTRPSWPW